MGLSLNVRGHVAFFQQNPRVWEFLTASLEEKNSKRNRELENFANFGLRVCEDLVYVYEKYLYCSKSQTFEVVSSQFRTAKLGG